MSINLWLYAADKVGQPHLIRGTSAGHQPARQ